MPRESEVGDSGPIVLTGIVECESCDSEFEGVWTDDSVDYEQMVEPPSAVLACPSCGVKDTYEYTGYWNFGDAG